MRDLDHAQAIYCYSAAINAHYSSDVDAHEQALVQALGKNVRERRRGRGLTRAALAERSGLSARFLGEVEAGRANISVVKLSRVARSLGCTAADLLQLHDAPTVALLGLRGAGKSTVGPELARRLGVPFVELDQLVEQRAGLPLYDVFSVHGESLYRRLEAEALADFLARAEPAVLATGGGIVSSRETFDRLKRACVTVWLRARPEDHMGRVVAQGDQRPMQAREDAMTELRQILGTRAPLYAEADLVVDTSGASPREVVERVSDALRRAGRAA